MDIHALFDAIAAQGKADRSNYHVTLGDLITALQSANKDKTVRDQNGEYVSAECDSYRGYYSDLSFEPGDKCTVAEMLDSASNAMGKTFEGYKGGDYDMGEDTPLWVAYYGSCGLAVVGVEESQDAFVLITKEID